MVSFIHAPSGITLFSRIFEGFCERINEAAQSELIGCFISAIKSFSQEFNQNEIKHIEMSNLTFLISEQDHVMIFFLLDVTNNTMEYRKSLKICLNAFLRMYHGEIKNNYNDISKFENFNSILQEILKISPDKIEPSCLNCPMGQKENCLFKRVKQKIREFNKSNKSKK